MGEKRSRASIVNTNNALKLAPLLAKGAGGF